MSPSTASIDGSGDGDGDVKTVLVGIKMDAQSRELLTWSLVKVAQPGDHVIALHVLPTNNIADQDGKSTLLSLVKTFDSVLEVYEGFCNLKQVDLKMQICRGSSIRKIIVREANLYAASKVVVGTATKHHTIRSSTSVAKYCARKLPKHCSVLAVRNGKVVFQRTPASAVGTNCSTGRNGHVENGLLEASHRLMMTDSKLNDSDTKVATEVGCNHGACGDVGVAMLKVDTENSKMAPKQNCTLCSPNQISSSSPRPCTDTREEPSGNVHEENVMALVPLHKLEAASSSLLLLAKELSDIRPGWPLLGHTLLSSRQDTVASSSTGVSVVQWAMLLPSRSYPLTPSWSSAPRNLDQHFDAGGQNDGIVPVGTMTLSHRTAIAQASRSFPRELGNLHEKYSSTCRLFKYEELQSATSKFIPENLVGKGGNSQVYRGSLPDGKELAVKILNPSEDVLQEFVREIEIITGLNHKNIISLFGFCFEENNPSLVYDLLPRGSLEENLHGSKKDLVAFGWKERYKVAVGVAEALNYLHNCSIQSVIHRDVKSSNILLSEDFEPQLCDFGLAKLASTLSLITCTDVAGTFGYLAPEYFMYGKMTDKIDVYAFGVVLLELLSGRKPISNEQPKGQESLVIWAKPILDKGKVSKLLDPCMGSDYDLDQIERMVLAATLCIRREPRARPQMSLIMNLLQGDAHVLRWARLQVNVLDNSDRLDDNGLSRPDLQSHLNLALLDVEDDHLSVSSIEQNVSLEEYFQSWWSRLSSFD